MASSSLISGCCTRQAVSNFDLFNMDDIDSAFQNCVPMTYSQHLPLAGKEYIWEWKYVERKKAACGFTYVCLNENK